MRKGKTVRMSSSDDDGDTTKVDWWRLLDDLWAAHRPCLSCSSNAGLIRGGWGISDVWLTLRRDDGTCSTCGTVTSEDDEAALRDKLEGYMAQFRKWSLPSS